MLSKIQKKKMTDDEGGTATDSQISDKKYENDDGADDDRTHQMTIYVTRNNYRVKGRH